MRALICNRYAERPDVSLGDVSGAAPGKGEVLVEVRAAGEIPRLPREDCMQAFEGFARRKVTGEWVLDLNGAAA